MIEWQEVHYSTDPTKAGLTRLHCFSSLSHCVSLHSNAELYMHTRQICSCKFIINVLYSKDFAN